MMRFTNDYRGRFGDQINNLDMRLWAKIDAAAPVFLSWRLDGQLRAPLFDRFRSGGPQ